MEGLLGRLQRGLDEVLEFDVGEVGAGFAANEVEILTVAITTVAQAQCGAALEDGMSAGCLCPTSRKQEVKWIASLTRFWFHLRRRCPCRRANLFDRAPKAGSLVVHGRFSSAMTSASVSGSMRSTFLPTRRRSRLARATVASSVPSSRR